MKALLARTALATALMVTITGAQAESMDFETSDTDTIVVGATAEKVSLRVMGFKNLQPLASSPGQAKLGAFHMSTSSGLGTLAVTYGAEHKPRGIAGEKGLAGTITNDTGDEVDTYISYVNSSTGNMFRIVTVDGTSWAVLKSKARMFEGEIYTYNAPNLPAGVYPITLRAALYQP